MTSKKSSDSPLHIFIDTNIFLSFYALANDDIEQLKKLVGLIRASRLKLYLTKQVRDEFYRNREIKLAESLRQFEKATLQKAIPRYMETYAEAKEYVDAIETLQKARNALVQKAKEEANSEALSEDGLFTSLVQAVKPISNEGDIYASALRRMHLNNPPGKPGSLGDRVNWEALLSSIPPNVDLHIISKDGDFESPLRDGHAHHFLIKEWQEIKGASLFLHPELRPFLNQRFPEIRFAVDVEKRTAIDALVQSSTFASTHAAVARIEPFVDALTDAESCELLHALVENSQVNWIAADGDVSHLYKRLLEGRESRLPSELVDQAKPLLAPQSESDWWDESG